jgi:hypothetical protein
VTESTAVVAPLASSNFQWPIGIKPACAVTAIQQNATIAEKAHFMSRLPCECDL